MTRAKAGRRARVEAIRNLPFDHKRKPTVGLEVFRLGDLVERARRGVLGHALETPQRPEFHTIYVGLRGRGTHVVDFAPVPLGENYVTVVARGRVQQFVVDPDHDIDAWMLLVEPSLVAVNGTRSPSVLSPAWTEPAIQMAPKDHAELLAMVELLVIEQARPLDVQQPNILAALLHALLYRVERHASLRADPSAGALDQFFTILDDACTRTRTVSYYAKQSGLSPRRLGELLVEQTGKSTKQVIDERVILEQKRLLAFTDITIKELAARTGFEEPTNLVKFFRHHTKTTPEAFRLAQREAAARTFSPSARGS